MLKNILNLGGVKQLPKNEQVKINGSLRNSSGFACYCNGVYKGDCADVASCVALCGGL